jgi:3-oxoacyl-[acyl-carrier protein] reductase
MDLSLKGKKALVCGSTQGIGFAAAKELASLGASIVLFARNEEKLKQASLQLDISQGQQHEYLSADFFNPTEVKTVLENYLKQNKTIHILVNNSGGPPAGKISEASLSDFLSALQNLLFSSHEMVKLLIPNMKQSGYGRIINVISTSVKIPLKGLGVSNTVRGATASWAKTLANELAQYNITVNNVLPGATKTQRLEGIIHNKASKTSHSVDAIEKEMLDEIPLGRFAKAEEIAAAIAFLASPAAAYITGINLPVDGGRTGSL